MPSLAGSSVLVLGATGGLGSRISRLATDRGATVVMVAQNQQRLDELDVPGTKLALDLRDPAAAETAVSTAVEANGKLDVVVNATGVVAFGAVADLEPDVLEELFLTNTFIPVFVAQAALGSLSKGGMIVNISGVIAEQNLPGMAAYGASKAAVRSFDEAFQREARRAKVKILDARPGHTETGLTGRAIAGAAPDFPEGLDPTHVATVIVDAIEADTKDLPSTAFSGA